MKPVSGRHRGQTATSSTPPTTDSSMTVHFPPESNIQSSSFSSLYARVESEFNHFHTVIHDPCARVAAISAIDKEFGAAMQQLRSQCNALAPISFLPPEVLAIVFCFLSFEEPSFSTKRDLGWIRATHVCRHWRQVALDNSSLWARISGFPTNTEGISEILARARSAPLDIDIKIGRTLDPGSKVLLMLSSHISHIRELRLVVSLRHFDSVKGICSQEAPALEIIELDVFDNPRMMGRITFPGLGRATLFKGQAPRLRMLSLSGLSHALIPWSLIPGGQLTHLKISGRGDDVPLRNDLNQLMDLLVNSPGLEVLILESCIPPQLTQSPHGQIIHLPHLSHISICGSSSCITNLLKILKLPSSTELKMYCNPDSEDAATYNDHPLLPIFSAHYQCPAIEFKSLFVVISSQSWVGIKASFSLPISRIRQPQIFEDDINIDEDSDFVLFIDDPELPGPGLWTDLVERVCKVLPISNLEFLSISAPDPDDSANWVELFKHCTKVTRLQAIGCGTSSLVRALATPKHITRPDGRAEKPRHDNRDSISAPAAGSTASYTQAIFPNLTSLSLKRLDFEEMERSSGILFDVVQKALLQRMKMDNLKILRIGNSAICAERAKALQELVQNFHWDGEDGFPDQCEFVDYESPWPWWEISLDGTMYDEQEWRKSSRTGGG